MGGIGQNVSGGMERVSEPQVVPIKSGWAAVGDGWAVHGKTQEEARRLFEVAELKHQEIDARPDFPAIPESGCEAETQKGMGDGRGYRD
jgi:hypothetical protein